MSDNFNLKEELKEIIKSYGGRQVFRELNAAHIPFFFAAAVENSEEGTEYSCEAITPNSIGITLKDDKFADFLDIRNKGFVTVPSFEAASISLQGLMMAQEMEKNPFYDEEALMQFAQEEGIEIEDDEPLDDHVVEYVIKKQEKPEAESLEPEYVPSLVCHGEVLDIAWGTDGVKDREYMDEFSRLDERHQEILKGDGSFLQEKKREAVYYDVGQNPQPVEDKPGTEGETDADAEDAEEAGNTSRQDQGAGEPDNEEDTIAGE